MKSRTTARCASARLLKGFASTIECKNGQTQENDKGMLASLILCGFVVDNRVSAASEDWVRILLMRAQRYSKTKGDECTGTNA